MSRMTRAIGLGWCLLLSTVGGTAAVASDINTQLSIIEKEGAEMHRYLSTIDKGSIDYSHSIVRTRAREGNILQQGKAHTARTLGMQAGEYYAQRIINAYLENYGGYLDEILDFSAYLTTYRHYLVMPPVVNEVDGRKIYTRDDRRAFRVSDKTYMITRQPFFIETVPTWRQYMVQNARPPVINYQSTLPEAGNKEERKTWELHFNEGWKLGIDQAIANTRMQLGRTLYDLQGIQRYIILRDKNLISEPRFQEVSNAVSGNQSVMNLGDRLVEISVEPTMQLDSRKWIAIPQLPPLESLLDPEQLRILTTVGAQ
ncbi:type IV secretory system conjugative DNA transfer family protein [Aliagarivorans taiwanensis]|uniref:type IV secretory system conjugative DNA transfer family protein n=1 Tax=Aliagarivorans taiwanensis TaxID=561966 RepID=UPI00040D8671|nr:type IV secretory system conjugative DNA transfer family protein [Aliagarivorans taiwanensis]